MYTRRPPKRVLDAHPPDQRTQVRINLRPPSAWARFPTPIVAKAGPMPTHQGLRSDNCEDLQLLLQSRNHAVVVRVRTALDQVEDAVVGIWTEAGVIGTLRHCAV